MTTFIAIMALSGVAFWVGVIGIIALIYMENR
jgi:hypothetical protein